MALTRLQDTEQIEKDVELLVRHLENLRKMYEQFFLGIIREQPSKLRNDVKEIINKHYGTSIQNASLKFKFQQCVSRYNTFTTYWDRTLRQIEDGTYQRDVFKAKLHEKERKEKTNPEKTNPDKSVSPKKKDIFENLFEEYKELKKQLKHDVAGLSLDTFREQLKNKVGDIENKKGRFSFKIVEEKGETKIKLLKKRTDSTS